MKLLKGDCLEKLKVNSSAYSKVHYWIKKEYGRPIKCEDSECSYKNPKRYEWANISGEYKYERSDWMQLCPSCHRKYDITDEIRKRMSEGRRGMKLTEKHRKILAKELRACIRERSTELNLLSSWICMGILLRTGLVFLMFNVK